MCVCLYVLNVFNLKVNVVCIYASGEDDSATRRTFVRLSDVGESTTETSPGTPAAADGRRLRVVTDDTASVLSSLSTLSTNSSGGVGVGDGVVSPHGLSLIHI